MGTLTTETFTGTTGAAWPAQWTIRAGATATIQSNAGRLGASATTTYQQARADLAGINAGDTDITFTVNGAVNSQVQFFAAFIDGNNYNTANGSGGWYPDNAYAIELDYAASAASSKIMLISMDNGVQNNRQTLTKTLTGTTAYKVRLQRIGTALRARVWAASGSEPGTWDVSYTISGTPYTGFPGILAANGSTAAIRNFTVDDLTVTDGSTLITGSGTADFTGAGTLVASGTPRVSRNVAFTGSGTLNTSTLTRLSSAVNFSGSGTLDTDTAPSVSRTVSFSGGGALAAATLMSAASTVSLSGAGTLAATGVVSKSSVSLSGSGSLSAQSAPAVSATVGFSGGGGLSVAQGIRITRTVNLSGIGSLATGSTPRVNTTVQFTGEGVLDAAGNGGNASDVDFSGSGSLAIGGTALRLFNDVDLAGAGTLVVGSTVKTNNTNVSFSGSGTLSRAATPKITRTVALTGDGSLIVGNTDLNLTPTVALSGGGTLIVGSLVKTAPRSVGFAGSGTLGATQQFITLDGANVQLTGTGVLAGTAKQTASTVAHLSGSGRLGVAARIAVNYTPVISNAVPFAAYFEEQRVDAVYYGSSQIL